MFKEMFPGQESRVIEFIDELLPSVSDRTMNDPAYLVSSKNSAKIFECLLEIMFLKRDYDKSIKEIVLGEETRDQVKNTLNYIGQCAGWSEVRITGMQILFIANIKVISNESYDKIMELLNEPAKPSQALIDLMNSPRRYEVK